MSPRLFQSELDGGRQVFEKRTIHVFFPKEKNYIQFDRAFVMPLSQSLWRALPYNYWSHSWIRGLDVWGWHLGTAASGKAFPWYSYFIYLRVTSSLTGAYSRLLLEPIEGAIPWKFQHTNLFEHDLWRSYWALHPSHGARHGLYGVHQPSIGLWTIVLCLIPGLYTAYLCYSHSTILVDILSERATLGLITSLPLNPDYSRSIRV
jgi:hypothetical protein